tara:strand:+ start:7565 stop:8053 length:489 start_codon:yes stop_codon:yes gene_type:complete
MIDQKWLFEQQRNQFRHDELHHQDVFCLSRNDRLKHFGLHFAKYCGRLARNFSDEVFLKTLSDWQLVALSASIALSDDLSMGSIDFPGLEENEFLMRAVNASGQFCDACEKIDHAEPFLESAKASNREILFLLSSIANRKAISLDDLITDRREQLRQRAFYR